MILPLFICVRGREVLPHFRDPIHGFIEVSLQEQKIIDSMPFQRLRNIKQLATTYLVYHGAEHTRFGHSIGVMHLVTRTFDAVVSKNPGLFRDNPEENEIVVKWYRQIPRKSIFQNITKLRGFKQAVQHYFRHRSFRFSSCFK